MNTYLTIMVTVLVATQLIRLTQNAIQLHWQKKTILAQISALQDITDDDISIQKRAFRLLIRYLEEQLAEDGGRGLSAIL